MRHRLAVRWWKHKPQWLWGPRHIPGEYVQFHIGPLELLLRSKARAARH